MQGEHANDSEAVAALVNFFPAAHAVQEVDDAPENCPAGHAAQPSENVVPLVELYRPATQSTQSELESPPVGL